MFGPTNLYNFLVRSLMLDLVIVENKINFTFYNSAKLRSVVLNIAAAKFVVKDLLYKVMTSVVFVAIYKQNTHL